MTSLLQTPIDYLNGIGSERAKLLKQELGLHKYYDLLNFFPNRYVDKSKFYKIRDLKAVENTEIQIVGKIQSLKEIKQKRGKRLVGIFADETGLIELVWFKYGKWLLDKLNEKKGKIVLIYGKLNSYQGKLSIVHPEIDDFDEKKKKNQPFTPVYPSTQILQKKGVSNRFMQKCMMELLTQIEHLEETLPNWILGENDLIERKTAYQEIHFPTSMEQLKRAQNRLKFSEFFYLQLSVLTKKIHHQTQFKSFPFEQVGDYFNSYYKNGLQFELTNAQKRVLKEIRYDLKQTSQMNRLLQGDVGSGKTVVAMFSMLIALDNNFQATLIAPTEILAQQHYTSMQRDLEQLGVQLSLLTGSTPTAKRKVIHKELQSGKLQILIGTHAILEEKVIFKNLGLAIVDEQHKFGVAQRARLYKKNTLAPHILVMTATPIPRTLAMTMYGDLSLSVIDELPKGRKEIKTVHRKDNQRLQVFQFLKQEIQKGRQVYIVYPLIEESKQLDYKDLMDGYESITRVFPLPEYAVSIVHGKMKPENKAHEMLRFVKGETQIMVSTTVIEVGVNVPNASVMVIENAEKFGLSQLHQLRGRVGRGAEQSYCILMTNDGLNENARKRISTMCQTNDGFQIAEVDLALRGPGDMMGKQQSGALSLKIGDLVKDKSMIELARNTAKKLLEKDPNLTEKEHQATKTHFKEQYQNKIAWSRVG